MTKTADQPKIFYAARAFKDSGTGKAFKAGAPIEVSQGEIENYEAAGLATDQKPEAVKADAA